MSIKAWNALLVLSLLIVLSGGGYILYQNNMHKQEVAAQKAAEEAAAKEEVERKAAAQKVLSKKFEDFLNGFLQDMAKGTQEYKKARGVLEDLVDPANLRAPDYIHENARLAENTVMSLQLQMDDIMQNFEDADQAAQSLINQFDGEGQKVVQAKWVATRDQNASQYMAFFTMDQDILNAYLELMEFYDAHREDVEVDVEHNRVNFTDPSLEEEEALLRGRIMELEAMRGDVLKNEKAAEEKQGG